MGAIRQKTVITFPMDGRAVSHAHTEANAGGRTMATDEPVVRGGTGFAPTPTEAMVGALLSCINVISHRIAERIGVSLTDMTMQAECDFDRRGVLLQEQALIPLPEIRVTINAISDGSAAQLAQPESELAMFCPLSNTIRQSGTRLMEIWNITPA